MPYSKVGWTATKLLTPARFNQMETQYDELISHWSTAPFRMLSTAQLVVEVSSTEPAQAAGRLYFNSSTSDLKFYISNGTSYILLSEV